MFSRLTVLALTLLTAGAGWADPVEIETARGTVRVDYTPHTVVAFDIAALDTLVGLGVPVSGTVDRLFVDYLDAATAEAEHLGSFWEPDVEGFHALQPDLIVVGNRSSDQLKPLGRISQTIDMTITAGVIEAVLVRLRAFGEVFDKADAAAALEQELVVRLAQARDVVRDKGDALVVMTNGPKISAYGADGRFAWLHQDVGLPEAAPELGASIHGEAISFEFIRDTDPDWLIVVDRLAAIGRPGEGAQVTPDNALVQQTKAWSRGQVIYLNAADIYIAGGGVQSMMRTLDQRIAAFSPG